jgi:hypothetical protein
LMLFMSALLPLCVRPRTSGAEATTLCLAASLYKLGREGQRVFAISSAYRRPRRIAATDGLLSPTYDVDPSNCGGVGKTKAGWSRPFP